jgi:hypothetical protein
MAVKQDGFVVSVARLILLGSNALVNVGKGKGSSLGGKHFRAPFVGSIKVGGGGGPTEGQALPLTLEARLIGNEGWPDVDAL